MKNITLLEQYASATGFPMHIFTPGEDTHHCNSGLWRNSFFQQFLKGVPAPLPPIWTFFTPEHLYFGGIRLQATGELVVIGPVLSMECTQPQAAQIMYHLGIDTQANDVNAFRRMLNSYPNCNMKQLKKHLTFLNLLLNGQKTCTPEQISFHWPVQHPTVVEDDIILPEAATLKLPQDMENRLLAMIRWGKPQDLEQYCNEIVFSLPHHPDVDLRMEQKFIIGANLLLSRAAASAGVNSSLLDEMVSDYLWQIENCASRTELSALFYRCAVQYARQVQVLHNVSSEKPLMFLVNSYIHAHIYNKLTSSIIAAGLNYSVSYLCAAFKQESGMTLTEYIQQEKIAHAQYLLEQNKKPADVSRLLEFSSPSYFSYVFRKHVGMSPRKYVEHVRHKFQGSDYLLI